MKTSENHINRPTSRYENKSLSVTKTAGEGSGWGRGGGKGGRSYRSPLPPLITKNPAYEPELRVLTSLPTVGIKIGKMK